MVVWLFSVVIGCLWLFFFVNLYGSGCMVVWLFIVVIGCFRCLWLFFVDLVGSVFFG